MTPDEAAKVIRRSPRISVGCSTLIGWECIADDLDPNSPEDRVFLAKAIRDCDGTNGHPTPHKVATSPQGALSLWHLPLETP